jgi:sodium-dependent dicarboxylate transporter 2/3/5
MRVEQLWSDRRVRKILIGFTGFFLLLLLPEPAGLTVEAHRTIALLAIVIYFWVTEVFPLPVTALAAGAALVLLNIEPDPNEAFAPYAEDTVFFILGSLILAEAISKSGADKAIATTLLRRIGHSKDTLLIGVITVTSFFSMLISDHAVAAIMLTVVMSIIRNTDLRKDIEFRKALLLAVAFAANIAGLATPSGGARNAVAIGYMRDLYGVRVSYLDWMVMNVPITLILIPVVYVVIRVSFRVKRQKLDHLDLPDVKVQRHHTIPLAILTGTIIMWITLGTTYGLGVIAIIGASFMFAFNVLDWEDARRGIPWGVPFIYGAALALGRTLQDTGAAEWIANGFFATVPLPNTFFVLAAILVLTVVATNFMSDGAAVAVVAPFSLALAVAAGVNVAIAGVMTAVASAFSFVLVIGTPPNVMVYSSGFLTNRDFLRTGLPMTIIATVVVLFLSQVYWPMVAPTPP